MQTLSLAGIKGLQTLSFQNLALGMSHIRFLSEAPMRAMALPSERREHAREDSPEHQITIVVDGRKVSTENWSMGGFRSYGLFHLNKKERFHGLIEGDGNRPDIPFVGKILRVEEDGARGVKLVEIELEHLLQLQESMAG
jgi:hypothetical protein